MKKLRRILSVFLLMCMLVSLLPAADASEVTYELDTDGIDPGAQYLIVASNNTALNGAGHPGYSTAVTVSGNQVVAFDGIEDCLWTVEAGTNSLKHGDRYLRLNAVNGIAAPTYQDTPFPMSISNNN